MAKNLHKYSIFERDNSNETIFVSKRLEYKKESSCFDSFTLFDVSVKQRIERLPR